MSPISAPDKAQRRVASNGRGSESATRVVSITNDRDLGNSAQHPIVGNTKAADKVMVSIQIYSNIVFG